MAGVFDVDLTMSARPVGHGYAEVTVDQPNAFFAVGESFRGHEFHYSTPVAESMSSPTCLAVSRGVGVGGARDGLIRKRVLAGYVHIHADGVPGWARGFVAAAAAYRTERRGREVRTDDRAAETSDDGADVSGPVVSTAP